MNTVYAFNQRAKIRGVVIFGNFLSSLKGRIVFSDLQGQCILLRGLKLIFFTLPCEHPSLSPLLAGCLGVCRRANSRGFEHRALRES